VVKINDYQILPHLSFCTLGRNLDLDKRQWRLSNRDGNQIQQATNRKVFEQGVSNQNLFSNVGQQSVNFSILGLINLSNQLCN